MGKSAGECPSLLNQVNHNSNTYGPPKELPGLTASVVCAFKICSQILRNYSHQEMESNSPSLTHELA